MVMVAALLTLAMQGAPASGAPPPKAAPVEVSLDEAGIVTGGRVLRSVPLLDEAALDAVRHWHYEPFVDGRAAPVKLVVSFEKGWRNDTGQLAPSGTSDTYA
jgi:TonB family protein